MVPREPRGPALLPGVREHMRNLRGDSGASGAGVGPGWRARALAARALLAIGVGAPESLDQAQQALAIAREVDDPALLARALTACGYTAAQNAKAAGPYFAEALGLARAL